MPNHIVNELTINETDKKLDIILQTIKGDEGDIDFESILPMPPHITRGDIPYTQMKNSNGENWYDWSIENWGTKWNAYDIQINDNVIRFSTAWSSPLPIFIKLSEMFPETTFSIEYADEDIGYNVGLLKLLGGEIIEETELSGTKEGHLLALELQHGGLDSYLEDMTEEEVKDTLKYIENLK